MPCSLKLSAQVRHGSCPPTPYPANLPPKTATWIARPDPASMRIATQAAADNASTSTARPQTPAGAPSSPFAPHSPFTGRGEPEATATSLPLKPGGSHLRVTNENKREYVLLKAHKVTREGAGFRTTHAAGNSRARVEYSLAGGVRKSLLLTRYHVGSWWF